MAKVKKLIGSAVTFVQIPCEPRRHSKVKGGGLVFTQNEPVAHFGLGDATNAEMVRIEWPSGIVQELRDVAARQFLTVIEPDARITPTALEVQGGDPATFTLTTTLAPPVEFQWKLNGVVLPGETNATLFIEIGRASCRERV